MARGGFREGAGRKRNYQSYVTQVKIRIKKLQANGIDVSNIKPMSEKQFNANYTATKNQLEAEGKKTTTVVRELIKQTVDDRVFQLSVKQVNALKQHPKSLTYYELRTGTWLKKEIAAAKKKSEDNDEDFNISKFVSTEFFGS